MAVIKLVRVDAGGERWIGFAKQRAGQLMALYAGIAARATDSFVQAGVEVERPFNEAFNRTYTPAPDVKVTVRGTFVNGEWLVRIAIAAAGARLRTLIKLFKNTTPVGDGFLTLDPEDAFSISGELAVGLAKVKAPVEADAPYTFALSAGDTAVTRTPAYNSSDVRRLFDDGHWPALHAMVSSTQRYWVKVPAQWNDRFPAFMPVSLWPVHYFLDAAGDVNCVASLSATATGSPLTGHFDIAPVAGTADDCINEVLGPAPSFGFNGRGITGAALATELRSSMPADLRVSRFALVFRMKDKGASRTEGEAGPGTSWSFSNVPSPWKVKVHLFGDEVELALTGSSFGLPAATSNYEASFGGEGLPYETDAYLPTYSVVGSFSVRPGGSAGSLTDYVFTGKVRVLGVVPKASILTTTVTTCAVADSFYLAEGRWADWGELRDLRNEVFGESVPEEIGFPLSPPAQVNASANYWTNAITNPPGPAAVTDQVMWHSQGEARPFAGCVVAYLIGRQFAEEFADYSGMASWTKIGSHGRSFTFSPEGNVIAENITESVAGATIYSSTAPIRYVLNAGAEFDMYQGKSAYPMLRFAGLDSDSSQYGAFEFTEFLKAIVGGSGLPTSATAVVSEEPLPMVVAPDVGFALYGTLDAIPAARFNVRIGEAMVAPRSSEGGAPALGWIFVAAGDYDLREAVSGAVTNAPHASSDGSFTSYAYAIAPVTSLVLQAFNIDTDVTGGIFSVRSTVRFSEYPQSFAIKQIVGLRTYRWVVSTAYLRTAGATRVCVLYKHPLAARLSRLLHCVDFTPASVSSINARVSAINAKLPDFFALEGLAPTLSPALDYIANESASPSFSVDTYKSLVRTGLRTFYSVVSNGFANPELADYLAGFDQTVVIFPYH